MKRIILSILAVAALASCSKTESAYVDQDQEIRMAPVTAMTTKAEVNKAIDGTTYPGAEHFTVIGYWAKEDAGSVFTEGTTYLDAVDFAQKGLYWAGADQSYYWPKNGSLRFACYSPTVIDGGTLTHDLATDTWTALNYVQSNDTEKTIDFMIAQTPASYTAETATENVSVVFEHALSWLEFQVKAQDAVAAEAFDVKSITVNNVFTQGNMVAEYPAKDWKVIDNSQCGYTVCTDAPELPADLSAALVPNTGVLVIPQATTTLTVTFVQNTLPGVEQSLEIPLILDGNDTPWEAGKHYIYTLIFGLDEILINPSVADWEDVEVPAIGATSIEVSNESELISALAAGKSVRLVKDIELTASAKVSSGDVLVELNGYNVTAVGDVFEVAGGTLSINGPGLVSAATDNGEPYCAVWAYGDGKVNIYGGEFKAGYPTGDYNDLIYANNNAVINVYGGKFYNSGKENAFVLNLKDNTAAKMNVYGGTFEKFNPANNKSEGDNTNFVAAGYNVIQEGDWYTVTAPAGAIELKEDAVVYGSINLNGGVFDGANNTITVPENPSDNGIIRPSGIVTIKNVTINGDGKTSNGNGLRAIYTADGEFTIDNVTVSGVTYAINVNATKETKLIVKNSNLKGWISYGESTTASFDNVTFGIDNYGHIKPYSSTIFTGCTFEKDYEIDFEKITGGEVLTFVNCKVGDEVITADNVATLLKSVDPADASAPWAQASFRK